jgi:hypothetical protein
MSELKSVVIAENPLEPTTWVRYNVEDVCFFLRSYFHKWPDTARIYHDPKCTGHISQLDDVTPSIPNDVDRLATLDGALIVVVYPGTGLEIAAIVIAVVALAGVIAMAILFKVPGAPKNGSPNNSISDRQNTARLGERIPDIFGQIRSIPDYISSPYKRFINNQEVEYAYFCIGRGNYDISDVRDGNTPFADITGATAEIYRPGLSPNNSAPAGGDRFGSIPINTPVYSSKRYDAVNGQELKPENNQKFNGNQDIYFTANEINLNPDSTYNFSDHFDAGDILVITEAIQYPVAAARNIKALTLYDYSGTGGVIGGEIQFINLDCPAGFIVGSTFHLGGNIVHRKGGYILGSNMKPLERDVDLSGDYVITGVTNGLLLFTIPSNKINDWALMAKHAIFDPSINGYQPVYSNFPFAILTSLTPVWNLAGTYTILTVASNTIVLTSPSLINSSWTTVAGLGRTPLMSSKLATSGPKWIGPFFVDTVSSTNRQYLVNFTADQGLYKMEGGDQKKVDILLEVEFTPVDINGASTGIAELYQTWIYGSAKSKTRCAVSNTITPTYSMNRYKIRARRITLATKDADQISETIQWRDLYTLSSGMPAHFGNVTTVQTVTYNTLSATSVKERKLNMLVTRRIPTRVSGSTFSAYWDVNGYLQGTVTGSKNINAIISAICLDPCIGRRNVSEIDFDSIYNTSAAIQAYFGTAIACEFNHTFDDNGQSFEETIAIVASTVHSLAYRQGNVIKLSFEKKATTLTPATILFNHRNKIPGSEIRSVRFGNLEDKDGVEVTYIDPIDNAKLSYFLPVNNSSANIKKIETIGVRNKLQAYFLAWRMWNKIRYQNVNLEFEATQEADLLVVQDRILVADNTRPETQDGEVVSQNVTELTLSQDVVFKNGVAYTIFLQHTDGTVESLTITQGSTARKVILSVLPKQALALADDLYARTTYIIVDNVSTREKSFLVMEKDPKDNFTSTVRAINYDDKYYANDTDFINSIVDIAGN